MKSFFLGCIFTLLAIGLFGFAYLKLGLYPVNADAEPHWLEKKLAKIAVNAHVEAQAADLKNPFAATPDVLLAGMKSFKSNCAGCHGSPQNKDSTFADALYPRAPQFGHKGLDDDIREIFWMTKHGIRMSGMPGFTTMMSDDEIWKLAVFIGNIDKLPADIQNQWLAAN